MTRLFTFLWLILGASTLTIYLLRPENRFVLGGVLLAVMISLIPVIKERLRRRREGFYVTMRGNADGGDLIYFEEGKKLTFYFDRATRTIFVPPTIKWENEMPDWAKVRRAQIMERIAPRLGKHWRFVDKEEQKSEKGNIFEPEPHDIIQVVHGHPGARRHRTDSGEENND